MKLTPQHIKILDLHADNEWHCSTEIEFIRDQRKRISELNAGGYTFEAMKCNLGHNHNANLLMRRLMKPHTPAPKFGYSVVETPYGPKVIKVEI